MVENKKLPVTVLSRNYSTGLGIIRSLGAAGYTIDLVASVKKKGSSIIASSSRYVRNSYEVKFTSLQEDKGDEIVDLLIKNGEKEGRMILLPADDFTASVMDRNRSTLEPYYVMPFIQSGADGDMIRLMDKTNQTDIARKYGIDVPREWTISLRDNILIPDDMIFPCFVKPIESVTGYKTEMKKCETAEELEHHLKEMQDFFSDRSTLVQEFLYITKEYDFSGICLDQDIIIPAVIEKTRIAQHERGVTMSGRVVSVEVLGPVYEKIQAMLREFRYVGIFDFELNVCGDRIYFNEVNLRSGGPNYSYYLNGVNLPEILVKHLLGGEHDKSEEQVREFGRSFVYEKVAWEEYINGCITAKERDQCISSADYTLLADENDPKPGKVFFAKIRLSALKHKLLYGIKKS